MQSRRVVNIELLGKRKVRDLHVLKNHTFVTGNKIVVHNCNSVQPALRNLMEEFSRTCGYILTCNFKNRIIEPLQSRCSLISFAIDKSEKPKLISQMYKNVARILKEEKVAFDPKVVGQIILSNYPDWRKSINELQTYAASGSIDSGILAIKKDVGIARLFSFLKDKNFSEVRKWVADNNDIEPTEVAATHGIGCFYKTTGIAFA